MGALLLGFLSNFRIFPKENLEKLNAMANQQELERWATALAEASILGDIAVCQKYGITDRSLRNWRTWLKSRSELRQLYEQKRRLFDSNLVDDLTARCDDAPVVVVNWENHRTARSGRYTARDLARAAAVAIEAVADRCGLPPVKAAECGHKLPTGRRVPLLISHRDGSYTLCATLTAEDDCRHDTEEARAIGQLLYGYEVARAAYRVPASELRLLVLADYDVSALWCRAVAHVDVQIGFFNVLDVVRDRLASQNVLASETAADAAEVSSQ